MCDFFHASSTTSGRDNEQRRQGTGSSRKRIRRDEPPQRQHIFLEPCPESINIVYAYSRFFIMHHRADEHIRDVLNRRREKGHDDEWVEVMKWILWLNDVD
jgi:hypothetical protein